MESYINNSVTNQSFNGTTDNVYSSVPLFATFLSIFLLLVVIPAVAIPAMLVICIILKTGALHTRYYLFVTNLLVTDILNTFKIGFEILLMCLYLFGINADTTISFIIYGILTIPRVAARLSFINLAIDRVVAIAFPYRHKKIMTNKIACILIAFTWLMSSIMALVVFMSSPFVFIMQFGVYAVKEKTIGRVIFFVFLLIVTIILIICINVYLYVKINQSKQKLEENMRTDGRSDEKEISQLNSTLHKFQKQIKTTVSLLILGGADGIINLLTMTMLIIMNRFVPLSINLYLHQFVLYPILCVQLMCHSLLYGIYMKDIRRKLCKCQKLKRMLPLRPSKVIVIN